jgi:hypothetical protein
MLPKERRRPGGRVYKANTTPTPNPNLSPQPVPEVPEQPNVTATKKTSMSKNPEPKPTEPPKTAPEKPKSKTTASAKTATTKPTTPYMVIPKQSSTFPPKELLDFFDHLPLHCGADSPLLHVHLLLPTGAARQCVILKIVILFVAKYGSSL